MIKDTGGGAQWSRTLEVELNGQGHWRWSSMVKDTGGGAQWSRTLEVELNGQ